MYEKLLLHANLETKARSAIGLKRGTSTGNTTALLSSSLYWHSNNSTLKCSKVYVLTACGSARKLWLLAGTIRFWDGRSPGFIYDLARYVLMALDQARNGVWDTIETLSYDKNKLQRKVERTETSAEERRSEPCSDMIGIMAQLTDLAQATHELTKTMAQCMEKSKEWPIQ